MSMMVLQNPYPVPVTSPSSPKYPTTVTQAPYGAPTWANLANAQTDDGSFTAASSSTNTASHSLLLTGFGFAIPIDATINDILVEIKRRVSSAGNVGAARDEFLYLLKGGAFVGGNHKGTATAWPVSAAYASYGGPTDLWGLTWTPEEINSTGFGVTFGAYFVPSGVATNVEIDTVRITVYFTP